MISRQLTASAQQAVVSAAVGPLVTARWIGTNERVVHATLADRSERIVKLVHPDAVKASQQRYRALPDHRGIVALLGGGVVGEFGYLVHPVYPRTLADVLALTPLPTWEAARLLAPVASAVESLHAAGWVHTDIKPANILMTVDGDAVLADLDDCVRIGAPAERVTPGFGAPEAIGGLALTPRADYFGFARTVRIALGGSGLDQASRVDPALAAIVDAVRLDTASTPARRIVRPSELVAIVRDSAAGAPPTAVLAAALSASGVADADPADSGLSVAAHELYGEVDLRAVTVDRSSLQLAVADEPAEVDAVTSVWRTPAMLAALGVAAVLILVAVVVVLVRGL